MMRIKNFVQLSIVVLCSCGFLWSCDVRKKDKIAVAPGKQVKVDAEPTTVSIIDSVYDFGTIREGDVVAFSYRFKNTGDKPLVITEALASCGCTVAEKPEKPVMPGEIGHIKVKFNSDKKPGEAHKSLTITSNAQPEFPQLLLKGTVEGKTETE
jgi:hypothetical protein